MTTVIIFMGLQAAGKTTLYRARFASTHILVSKDLLRNNRRPDRRQTNLIRTALETGRSVVVDNTNPSRADREDIIALAREYDTRIVGYFFEAALDDCLRRNATRTGRARVPEVALFSTQKKLERPSLDEGFDALNAVRTLDDGTFEITPLKEPS